MSGPEPLIRPLGLLLDFGGVLVHSEQRTGWARLLAEHVVAHAATHHVPVILTASLIEEDILAGATAAHRWKDAMSRPLHPTELTYDQFWSDFVAGDWPAPLRQLVGRDARQLCHVMGELRELRTVRPGIPELLQTAAELAVPVGVVSNALAGSVHRDFLAAYGWSSALAAEVYSDEVGLRKPHPGILALGAQAIGVDLEHCWYVGDNFDRDVLCGHRAGVGGNVLMEARDTYELAYPPRYRPHAVVADPGELRRALLAAHDLDVARPVSFSPALSTPEPS